ncbi:DUF429 domain-containing protein [candidate division KSB1 bacterium]|nr:DUF429 domain-containing protein [candidate division KSB1 bacterium]
MKFIGVDGCKIGWFFVSLDQNAGWDFGILAKISELAKFITESALILADIPIGLREVDKNERRCDLAARRVLKQRRSSVFPAPARLALNCKTYEAACHANFACTGRKLSQQSWAIAAKIKAMDDFLGTLGPTQKIREIHPEVGFWALNRYAPMQYNKKSQEGFNERIALLSDYGGDAKAMVAAARQKYHSNEVASDDILDAAVAAVTARFQPRLGTLPETPERDPKGLPMEIVFAKL